LVKQMKDNCDLERYKLIAFLRRRGTQFL